LQREEEEFTTQSQHAPVKKREEDKTLKSGSFGVEI
jgi:hypothetical protein